MESKMNEFIKITEGEKVALIDPVGKVCLGVSKRFADNLDKPEFQEKLFPVWKQQTEFIKEIENNHEKINTVYLMVTRKCNMNCDFCAISANDKLRPEKEFKLEDIQNKVIPFFQKNKPHKMILTGGEPLIKDQIVEIAKALRNGLTCPITLQSNGLAITKELTEQLKGYIDEIDFSTIITNGTLLTAEIVSQLINYNCQQIQITLDGMPDTHNARRKYKDGKGSFEQIISALELLNNKCADIHTVIRINVDKNNLDEVSTLLEYLGINGKGLTNCNVDFGIVRGSTQACSAYSGNCLSESIVGEVLSKLWSKAEMEGFTLYTKPFHRWIYCGLYADSQFTVTPNGELYKCWEHAGDEQHLMGNINENGNIDNIKYSFYDWMSHNPLENEECKECVYLPACGGGCGVVSYNETNSYHSKGCFKVKGVLEKQVLRYFKGKI